MDIGNVASKNTIYIKGVSNNEGEISLRPGEVVQARVISVSDNNVILRIGNSRIVASSGVPLEKGSTVLLAVAEVNSNRVVLRHINGSNIARTGMEYSKDDLVERFLEMAGIDDVESKNALRVIVNTLKGKQIDTGSLLDGVLSQLEGINADSRASKFDGKIDALISLLNGAIIASDDKDEILASIRVFVDSLQHESEIVSLLNRQDIQNAPDNLKALLLSMRAALDADLGAVSGKAIDEDMQKLLGSTEKLLQSLNAVGTANVPIHSNSDGFFYLPIPIRCGDNIGTAEIRIFSKDGRAKGANSNTGLITVGFALNMPALGSTRALLEVCNNTLNLLMAFENKEAVEAAKSLSSGLAESFESLGYGIGRISVMQLSSPDFVSTDSGWSSGSLIGDKLGIDSEGVDVYG